MYIFFVGVVILLNDYEICKEGSVLNPSQAKMLELLDYKLESFKLLLKGRWTKGEGFEKFNSEHSDSEDIEIETND